ncbi:MAG: cob(I)yrinic acid a,c-diamide adenosyltransferase [Bryobacteraceae bacterium]
MDPSTAVEQFAAAVVAANLLNPRAAKHGPDAVCIRLVSFLRPSTSLRLMAGVLTLSEPIFNEPRIALNRIYTRRGDAGETTLVGGQRVHKDDLRIESYGTVDELNAFIGAARVTAEELAIRFQPLHQFAAILKRVQHELFNLGSILATLPEDVHPKQPRITTVDVVQLETEIDEANEALAPLRSFVLPGGSRLDADLHIARTVCRRAERLLVALGRAQSVPSEAVQYLNRLSDALFVWSRWANHVIGATETLWEPNAAAGAVSG